MGSSFYDLRNISKESVVVDFKTRESGQQVKLSNEDNVFNGTFCGKLGGGAVSSVAQDLSSDFQRKGNYISCCNEISNCFNVVKVHGKFKNAQNFCFYVLSC